jgi:hypothetical protein
MTRLLTSTTVEKEEQTWNSSTRIAHCTYRTHRPESEEDFGWDMEKEHTEEM